VVAVRTRDRYRDEVVARYEAGESIRKIAAALHLAYGTVQNLLCDAGVKRRRPGRPAKHERNPS